MVTKRLYIAGPMSHYPGHNYDAFHAARRLLVASGHAVVDTADPTNLDDVQPWDHYIRHALRQVLDCDGVALLDGWEASRGARLEVHVAHALGMPTLPLKLWLTP